MRLLSVRGCSIHGCNQSIEVVFDAGSRCITQIWCFPALQNYDAALKGLVSHEGKQVSGIVESPRYYRVDFTDGSAWITSCLEDNHDSATKRNDKPKAFAINA